MVTIKDTADEIPVAEGELLFDGNLAVKCKQRTFDLRNGFLKSQHSIFGAFAYIAKSIILLLPLGFLKNYVQNQFI